jgi:4-hydroxythreonine-4-phosphate dehydrogenase
MGDAAGIGPEVIALAWRDGRIFDCCRPVVIGHPQVLERALKLVGSAIEVAEADSLDAPESTPSRLTCINPGGDPVAQVRAGALDARAGQAACDYLAYAASAALDGRVDALTTAPINKAALRLAGLHYPGHTEILAEMCGVRDYAMMLYLPRGAAIKGNSTRSETAFASGSKPGLPIEAAAPAGLGVVHVTLHAALRSVPEMLSTESISAKIRLLDSFLKRIGFSSPRIGICALNPHAGEEGLFGEEEGRVIAPAVEAAKAAGAAAIGPLPADTLLLRAWQGEFDGVVAMYHDQGHIALKLVGIDRAVNITLGLPIVRTSPSHGTAFDIAWQGRARSTGFIEAVEIAASLAETR